MDQSGVYGYPDMVALQHFHDFLQQIKQFSVERIERQLECFDERFRTLKQEFIEVYTTSCSSKSPVQTAKTQQPPKKLDILSQKYRTPMGKTVYSVLGGANVNKALDDMNESLSSGGAPTSANDVTYNVKFTDEPVNHKTAPKKRNAKAADISIVNEDSADERDQDKENNNNNYKETTKVKKSSKKVVDEENNDDGTETEEATSTKKKAGKANAKSGKKKKKLKTGAKKGKKTKDDNEGENNDEQPDQKAEEEEEEEEEVKGKRRPSKKFKSSEEGEENTNKEPQAAEKKEKKKKLTKQKTITDSTDQADKTLTGQRLSKHMLKSTMKTPSNIKRISLKILQSTIKKSTKPKRPLTRRAAAAEKAAAAAKSSVVSSSSSTATSSSTTAITKMTASDVVASISGETTKASNIPQLIRPQLELIRTNTKDPGRIPATPQSTIKSTNNNFKFVKNTISKINKTFRSSIDKHKARLSQSKPDAKKKSEKQVKAFLNVVGDKTTTENLVKTKPGSKEMSKLIEPGTISSSSSSTTTTTTTTTTTSSITSSKKDSNENRNDHNDDDDMIDATVIITDDESEHTEPKTPDSSSVNNKSELKSTYHLHKDRELIEKSFKSRSPKLLVSKIPEHLLQPNVSAAHADKIMNDNDKRLTREPNPQQQQSILGTVQQPSRMLPMKAVSSSAIKATPSRPNYLQTGIPRPIISSSTSNLMTPSKLTWTEMEEKRKAELALKEAKDKERLADLEKQRQEKRDELKKKREEKVKKVNDLKARQKEEQEAKAKEMEKKRLEEAEKKKQVDETTKLDADRSKLVVAKKPLVQPVNNMPSSVFGSAQKKPNIVLNPISLNKMSELTKAKNLNEEFKKSLVNIPKPIIPTVTYEPSKTNAKNFEQTYILDQSPKGKSNHHNTQSYEVTPLQPPKLKDQENYDVSDLRSGDDTDDDEAPSKPIPDWAREPYLNKKAQIQSSQMVNFTKLFKSASKAEINLEQIFRIKRKKFVERSSSANWTTPPIWSGNGINGEESFLQLRNIAND